MSRINMKRCTNDRDIDRKPTFQTLRCAYLSFCAIFILLFSSKFIEAQEIIDDRYEQLPRVNQIDIEILATDTESESHLQLKKNSILRFVEGVDVSPKPITQEDIKNEINDPFGKLLVSDIDRLPSTVNEVLSIIEQADSEESSLPVQSVYLVHDAGQIPIDAAPNLKRRPRAILLRRDDRARQSIFIAPSMRVDGTLEVMSWDNLKEVFNFYERRFSENDTPIWIWKGDSSHAWHENTRKNSCFRCHRNGELNMKELRLPWQNWHSQSGTIKPESIPVNSPLKSNPLFSVDPPSPYLEGGEKLERIVNQWISRSNETKAKSFTLGLLSADIIIEPFFRTSTANLISSTEQSESIANRPIILPTSFFLDQRGFLDIAEISCDSLLNFPSSLIVPRSKYREIIKKLGFRLEQPGTYLKNPGETFFAFFTSEVPRVDFDLIKKLIVHGIVSQRLAANLMMVDYPNPVYSPIRESLYEILKGKLLNSPKSGSLDEIIVEFFSAIANSPGKSSLLRMEAEAFQARWEMPSNDWDKFACSHLESYTENVIENINGDALQDYFKLLASRYAAFQESNHAALIESHLLLPKTDKHKNLYMKADGSVGHFQIDNN